MLIGCIPAVAIGMKSSAIKRVMNKCQLNKDMNVKYMPYRFLKPKYMNATGIS